MEAQLRSLGASEIWAEEVQLVGLCTMPDGFLLTHVASVCRLLWQRLLRRWKSGQQLHRFVLIVWLP